MSVSHISLTCQATVVDRFYFCIFMTGFSINDDMSSYDDMFPWDIFLKINVYLLIENDFEKKN
jgi:hypothetical protein